MHTKFVYFYTKGDVCVNYLEEIFHQSVFLRGGRYEVQEETLLDELKKECQEIIGSIRRHRDYFPAVHIDFINDIGFNACAFKNQGLYFIGINIGVVQILKKLFGYILSHPKLLTEIGDSSKEIEKNILNNVLITDHNYFRLFMNYDVEIDDPIDETRKAYSKKLLTYALEFLILHEYGHITNGHVDYFSNRKGTSFIFEFSQNQEKNLLMQTLEMDADAFAANYVGRRLLFNDDPIYQFFELKEDLKQKCYASYFMFRLFGKKEYDLSKLEKCSHPVPGIRQNILFTTIFSLYIQELKGQLMQEEEVKGFMMEIIDECETALKQISDKTFTPVPMSILLTHEGNRHFINIMENWQNVRPLLEPYSKIKLAPVTNWDDAKRRI